MMGGGAWTAGLEWLRSVWPEVAAVLHIILATACSIHAVMTKEEPRGAIGWIGLVWLSPFLGPALYYLLGINRIRRKAVYVMRSNEPHAVGLTAAAAVGGSDLVLGNDLDRLAGLGDRIGGLPLTPGNFVHPLENGDEAYPAMLAAIRGAERSVALSSYIFDFDDAGKQFLVALSDAVKRGVEVRVLVDATGARYSFPTIVTPLKRAGVRVARFLPGLAPTRIGTLNLRNHRKIMVVDGALGFAGGMNIREENYQNGNYAAPIRDLHFLVEGPVVGHLRQAFIEDWAFTTREILRGDAWLPPLPAVGARRSVLSAACVPNSGLSVPGAADVVARGILDGPDKDFEKILWTILGAISSARRSIRIVTPYFLPDPTTMRFLGVAALSGVHVEIIIPERCNVRLVQWASMALLPELLRKSCCVYLSPLPFDHSKMMLIDDAWAFVGSANWDARSMRLNFEFNVECYSRGLVASLGHLFDRRLKAARSLTLEELERRRFPVKLRDGVVRLLAPYL